MGRWAAGLGQTGLMLAGRCWNSGWAESGRCWAGLTAGPRLLDWAVDGLGWATGIRTGRREAVGARGASGAEGCGSSRGKASEFWDGGCPDELRAKSVWEPRVAGELGVRESYGQEERSGAGSVRTGMSSEFSDNKNRAAGRVCLWTS
ncbi:hypothetical protein CDL15_Pgr016372 [Punica granatum]|uniref:Uncharacterized protein n=1 Tax=Punica granatum TaxID=22663 RepID=A0A218W7U5_PUNGR|nr:hypothetical protein CDL15_Pgr016372 [Punica granatum]PKI58553.1 hypothetical protein CRG98_021016 [Punica granatum]